MGRGKKINHSFSRFRTGVAEHFAAHQTKTALETIEFGGLAEAGLTGSPSPLRGSALLSLQAPPPAETLRCNASLGKGGIWAGCDPSQSHVWDGCTGSSNRRGQRGERVEGGWRLRKIQRCRPKGEMCTCLDNERDAAAMHSNYFCHRGLLWKGLLARQTVRCWRHR